MHTDSSNEEQSSIIKAPAIAAVFGASAAFGATKLSEEYGLALFCLLPFIITTLAAFIRARKHEFVGVREGRSDSREHLQTIKQRKSIFWDCYKSGFLSLFMTGALILVFAIDGLLCLIMAAPLAFVIAIPGAMVGLRLARFQHQRNATKALMLLMASFPLLMAAEYRVKPEAPIHSITTTIKVKAPIHKVWKLINAYPVITAEPEWFFRCGIGCPMAVRLEGQDVGSTRYCDFTTGTFVEPITHWEEPTLLAFDVSHSPPPMKELSIYSDLQPAHLNGCWENKRGQFKLSEKDGVTTIEGTSWYQHHIAPDFYWHQVSDAIVRRIHLRVVTHIKELAEAQTKE